MAKSTKGKAIWAENEYRDAFDRARGQLAGAGEHLQRGDYAAALQELEAADGQLRSIIDLLNMKGGGR